jgi:hypothetical protein
MFATWLIQGLTMDAWAHTNQTKLETVVTPWQRALLRGFGVTAAWICWQIHLNFKAGRSRLGAVPVGYGVALIGMGLFFLSGVGDQIWHARFGIERDLEAFLSPSHTLLVIGMALLVTAPFRSDVVRSASSQDVVPRAAASGLVALADGAAVRPLRQLHRHLPERPPTISRAAFATGFPGGAPIPLLDVFSARFQVQGVVMLYLTTLLLMAPVLLALRRWQLPFGSITFMWTLVVASNSSPTSTTAGGRSSPSSSAVSSPTTWCCGSGRQRSCRHVPPLRRPRPRRAVAVYFVVWRSRTTSAGPPSSPSVSAPSQA